jgi:hypothetical protein
MYFLYELLVIFELDNLIDKTTNYVRIYTFKVYLYTRFTVL